MEEHNIFVRVRYGLEEHMCDKEVHFSVSSTEFNEENLMEVFRKFIQDIKSSLGPIDERFE